MRGEFMAEEWKEFFEKRIGDFKDEIIHQFHVIFKDVISKVQQVADGVINLIEKLDRCIDELDKKTRQVQKRLWANRSSRLQTAVDLTF